MTDGQRRMMWSCLHDIARQIEWHGMKLEPTDYKHMATAALRKQRVVPGIDGGFVVLAYPTSNMSTEESGELITFLHAFGDERGVKWSRSSLGRSVPDEVFAHEA